MSTSVHTTTILDILLRMAQTQSYIDYAGIRGYVQSDGSILISNAWEYGGVELLLSKRDGHIRKAWMYGQPQKPEYAEVWVANINNARVRITPDGELVHYPVRNKTKVILMFATDNLRALLSRGAVLPPPNRSVRT